MFMYENENGVAAIVYPASRETLEAQFGQLKDDEYQALILKGIPKHAVPITPDDLPADRYFRDAWEVRSGKIAENIDKAREIHLAKIRKARANEFKKLDIAQLNGQDVSTEKQTLRDLPATLQLDKIEHPDDLRAVWPTELESYKPEELRIEATAEPSLLEKAASWLGF